MTACIRCHTPLPGGESRFCPACGADQTGGGAGASAGSVATLLERLQRAVEGKYRIERMLGKGGMGAVFLAHDLTLDREVAIKVLPPDVANDDHVVKRFQQEARTAAKLDHTNIIPIYRVESEAGLNYFVMKYISGTSLEDVLEKGRPLPVDDIQRILYQAALALGHAHQRGIVHRDVKPANIMFDHDGKVMLTDFGISKALQAASGFTGTGMIIGTPHYMAPEQAKGQSVDGRADEYSLAVVGYRMITGALPFAGDSIHTILYKHIFEEPPQVQSVRQDVPDFLSLAIHRGLAKDPAQRYATMEEFASAVWPEQAVPAPRAKGPATPRAGVRGPVTSTDAATEVVAAAPTTPMPGPRRPRPAPARRSKTGPVIGTLAVLAALGTGAWYVLGRATPPAPGPQPPAASAGAPTNATAGAPNAATGAGTPASETPANPAPASSAPPATRTAAAPPRGTRAERPPERQPAAPPAAAVGYLEINSYPVGATVYVDGAEAGPTPLIDHEVSPGAHTIRIELLGYRPVQIPVHVAAGQRLVEKPTLTPQ